LKNIGVSKDQSSKWQKLAAIPDDEFDRAIGTKTAKPSTNGIIRDAAPPKVVRVSDEALWLWGRLRDFERDGLLDKAGYKADKFPLKGIHLVDDGPARVGRRLGVAVAVGHPPSLSVLADALANWLICAS
jgi:hypothetical protein